MHVSRWRLLRLTGLAGLTVGLLAYEAAPARAQNGSESLYKAKCASCHAADGSGTAVGKKLGVRDFKSAEVQRQTDAGLTEIIAKGKGKMPGYEKSLKPEQIKELAAYCRELGKKK